jgi:hypothetical protein
LEREVAAWEEGRNERMVEVRWQFTTADARIKLRRLYPTIQEWRTTRSSTMPPEQNRWAVKTLMIVIALTAVILYCGMLFVRSYIWMVRAGW